MGFEPSYIASYNSGLEKNKKPFLLMDTAWQELTNAYCFRDRIVKREGIQLAGRLRRKFNSEVTAAVTLNNGISSFNLYTQLGITEPNASIERGDATFPITLTFAAPINEVWTDATGTGVLTGFSASFNFANINYSTGVVTYDNNTGGGIGPGVLTITLNYYPSLPVMGITQRERSNINNEQTILYDTTYAYLYDNNSFQEFVAGSTWTGTDNDFFWSANYRGSTEYERYYFVTNSVNNAANNIRYYDGATLTNFFPILSEDGTPLKTYLTQARILIPYYGRLLALNTYESVETGIGSNTPDYAAGNNFFNRCRFSQIGSPVAVDAWRSDQFGKGGFIDAPTNESILSAIFYKNTLLVFFEKSTWQLRYVGEYGLPFLWERVSSDFGSDSTFAPILFDNGILTVGDRAITAADGNTVNRVDLQIPDEVFGFKNADNAHRRIQGIRNFQKELVYWTYCDGSLNRKFPNFNLVYNYRNNTYAKFRNNITAYGKLGNAQGVTWDSLDITWDSTQIKWETIFNEEYLYTVSGNQQGYIHFFGEPSTEAIADSSVAAFDQESLYISDIDRSGTIINLTVYNHNLEDDEIIYITDMQFVDNTSGGAVTTDLNDNLYIVQRVDSDTINIARWDFTNQVPVTDFSYVPAGADGDYAGGGNITLFPRLEMQTKDFNIYSGKGFQTKFGHLDVLTDASKNARVTIEIYKDNQLTMASNASIGNKNTNTALVLHGFITNATQAANCVITTRAPHNMYTGWELSIENVKGMTELNGGPYVVTVVDENTLSLSVDSTAFTAYTSGGNWLQANFPYYVSGSDYTWHRFYAGTWGNYFSLKFTYNNDLMNTFNTHAQDFQLNAIRLYSKPAGKGVF